MATNIRTTVSRRNKYWLSKHRMLELKHFCLQYPEWKKSYAELEYYGLTYDRDPDIPKGYDVPDPTAVLAIMKAELKRKMEMVEKAANEADTEISYYIFKAVTEDLSFVKLKMMYEIPCERDMYYERYRRLYWVLSKLRK